MTKKKVDEITHEYCIHHRMTAIFLHPTDREKCSISEWCELHNDLNKDAKECRQFKHLRTILKQAKLTDKKWSE